MKFGWDSAKNRSNMKKHGFSFEEALTIFAGTVLSFPDKRRDYGENRTISIGESRDGVVVLVVHTDRGGTIRMISARPANRKEKEWYNGYIETPTQYH